MSKTLRPHCDLAHREILDPGMSSKCTNCRNMTSCPLNSAFRFISHTVSFNCAYYAVTGLQTGETPLSTKAAAVLQEVSLYYRVHDVVTMLSLLKPARNQSCSTLWLQQLQLLALLKPVLNTLYVLATVKMLCSSLDSLLNPWCTLC